MTIYKSPTYMNSSSAPTSSPQELQTKGRIRDLLNGHYGLTKNPEFEQLKRQISHTDNHIATAQSWIQTLTDACTLEYKSKNSDFLGMTLNDVQPLQLHGRRKTYFENMPFSKDLALSLSMAQGTELVATQNFFYNARTPIQRLDPSPVERELKKINFDKAYRAVCEELDLLHYLWESLPTHQSISEAFKQSATLGQSGTEMQHKTCQMRLALCLTRVYRAKHLLEDEADPSVDRLVDCLLSDFKPIFDKLASRSKELYDVANETCQDWCVRMMAPFLSAAMVYFPPLIYYTLIHFKQIPASEQTTLILGSNLGLSTVIAVNDAALHFSGHRHTSRILNTLWNMLCPSLQLVNHEWLMQGDPWLGLKYDMGLVLLFASFHFFLLQTYANFRAYAFIPCMIGLNFMYFHNISLMIGVEHFAKFLASSYLFDKHPAPTWQDSFDVFLYKGLKSFGVIYVPGDYKHTFNSTKYAQDMHKHLLTYHTEEKRGKTTNLIDDSFMEALGYFLWAFIVQKANISPLNFGLPYNDIVMYQQCKRDDAFTLSLLQRFIQATNAQFQYANQTLSSPVAEVTLTRYSSKIRNCFMPAIQYVFVDLLSLDTVDSTSIKAFGSCLKDEILTLERILKHYATDVIHHLWQRNMPFIEDWLRRLPANNRWIIDNYDTSTVTWVALPDLQAWAHPLAIHGQTDPDLLQIISNLPNEEAYHQFEHVMGQYGEGVVSSCSLKLPSVHVFYPNDDKSRQRLVDYFLPGILSTSFRKAPILQSILSIIEQYHHVYWDQSMLPLLSLSGDHHDPKIRDTLKSIQKAYALAAIRLDSPMVKNFILRLHQQIIIEERHFISAQGANTTTYLWDILSLRLKIHFNLNPIYVIGTSHSLFHNSLERTIRLQSFAAQTMPIPLTELYDLFLEHAGPEQRLSHKFFFQFNNIELPKKTLKKNFLFSHLAENLKDSPPNITTMKEAKREAAFAAYYGFFPFPAPKNLLRLFLNSPLDTPKLQALFQGDPNILTYALIQILVKYSIHRETPNDTRPASNPRDNMQRILEIAKNDLKVTALHLSQILFFIFDYLLLYQLDQGWDSETSIKNFPQTKTRWQSIDKDLYEEYYEITLHKIEQNEIQPTTESLELVFSKLWFLAAETFNLEH